MATETNGSGSKHTAQPEVLQQLYLLRPILALTAHYRFGPPQFGAFYTNIGRSRYARIEPLGVYLQRVLRPAVPVLQPGDPQDYRYVLERCLVAQPGPSLVGRRRDAPPRSPTRLASSQPEVVRQVIETLFRESANPDHVLALGNCRPRFGGLGSTVFHGVEQLIPSSAASALQTKPWAALLQRVGDAAMMTLLLECSLFLPTLGSTLLQLSGAPVNKVVHQLRAPSAVAHVDPRKSSQLLPPPSPPYKRPRPAGSGHASEEPQTGPTPQPSQCLSSLSQAASSEFPDSQMQLTIDAMTAAQHPSALQQPEPTPTLTPILTPQLSEPPKTDRPIGEPTTAAARQAAQQQEEGQPKAPKEHGSDPCMRARNRLMISRRKLFYNFHFSKMVGLPHDHPLVTCGATINGARRLFHQVFTPSQACGSDRHGNARHKANARSSFAAEPGTCSIFRQAHDQGLTQDRAPGDHNDAHGKSTGQDLSSQKDDDHRRHGVDESMTASSTHRHHHSGRKTGAVANGGDSRQRIDSFCRPLVPLLLEVLRRHQRAPYARILEHHCPLPPQFSKPNATVDRQPTGCGAAAEKCPTDSSHGKRGPSCNQQRSSKCAGVDGADVRRHASRGGNKQLDAADHDFPPQEKSLNSPETQPLLPVSLPLPPTSQAAVASAVAQQTPDLPVRRVSTVMETQAKSTSSAADGKPASDGSVYECFEAEASVIRMHSAHYAVAGFVKTTLRFLIPVELWGGEENMRCCFKHVDRFVRLRRFENFSLKEATHRLKSRDFPPPAAPKSALPQRNLTKRPQQKHKERSQTSGCSTENVSEKGHDPCQKRRREHPNRLALRQRLLDAWIYWIFTQLVIPLIRTGFYATECEGFRNRVFFFRKPVWAVVRKTKLRQLNQEMFQALTETEAASVVSRRDFGFAGLRMLPKKEKGVRLITNMSRRTRSKAVRVKGKSKSKKPQVHADKVPTSTNAADASIEAGAEGGGTFDADKIRSMGKDKGSDGSASVGENSSKKGTTGANVKYKRDRPRSINDALIDAFLVLKHEKLNNPMCWGASVFGLHDIYKKLLPFVQEWRNGTHASRGVQHECGQSRPLPLYFATIDIRHCYDTIPHQVLCDRVLPLVLREPAYVCARYARVSHRPPRQDETPSGENAGQPGESLHVRYAQFAFPLKDLDRLVQRSRGGESGLVLQPWRKRCTILVNQESQSVVDREVILATIREHVTQNIIKVDGRYLRTKTGIPQGSVLSVLLCGLFYAHLENHVLRPVLPLGPFGPRRPQAYTRETGQVRPQSTGALGQLSGHVRSTDSGTAFAGKRRRNNSGTAAEEQGRNHSRRRMQPRSSIRGSCSPDTSCCFGPEHSSGDGSTDGSDGLKTQELIDSPLELVQQTSQPRSQSQSQTGAAASASVEADKRQEFGADTAIVLESGSSSDEDTDATVELDSSDAEQLLTGPQQQTRVAASMLEPKLPRAGTSAVPTPDHPPAAAYAFDEHEHHGQCPHIDENGHCSLLLRLVDDFLYITTDLGAAQRFVTILHGHIPEYDCTVHHAKTQTSFNMPHGKDVGAQPATTTTGSGTSRASGFIPWCGLLLKVSTLEVQADYSRYLGEDFRLRDSFTVEASRSVGSTLRRRLYSFLRPKCHGVLLDTRINSLPTVWLNVYQAFLLAAIKFHCYTRALPQRHLNVQFFTRCVLQAVQAMRSLIRRRISTVSAECTVSTTEVHWLGLRAFQYVLRRKHAFYQPMLPDIDQLLNRPAYRALEQRLGPTTDPHRSPDFQKMIY